VSIRKPIFGLIAVLAGICQITAQVKPNLTAASLPPINTLPHPAEKQAKSTAGVSAACDSLDDKALPGTHTVRLSWNPSIPASALTRDAVIGYIVYRSIKSHDAGAPPINTRRLTDTTCVDTQVVPGQTYYYVTRAVSASGALSGPSNEVRVQIPASVKSSIK
jgi:hypothetical protein